MAGEHESPEGKAGSIAQDAGDRSGIFAGDDPFAIAARWLEEAEKSEPNDPNAMALATVDADGMPDARMVLLKEIEPGPVGGFVFYTNYESAKGREIEATGKAAFVMHWKSLRRQIRARGLVERVSPEQSDRYFETRPLQSRIGARVSRQSRPLASRGRMMLEVAREAARSGMNPSRPAHWGGYRIVPLEIEFWADGAFRLHDRFLWKREDEKSPWKINRLYP